MTIITPSRWMKDQVSQSFLQEKQCEWIPNGINTDIFKPSDSSIRTDLNLKNQKMILGIALSLSPWKGIDDLIALSRILSAPYRLMLVGVPENAKRALPDSIIALPRTNHPEQLAQYYSASDVLVNPTHEDNLPTVNLEAQACGTPVATYQVGGSPESLTEETGIAVPEGNVEVLRDQLIRFAEQKEKVSRICRKHIQETYSLEIFTNHYLELYRSILNS